MRERVAVWGDRLRNVGRGASLSYAEEWAARLGWALQSYDPDEMAMIDHRVSTGRPSSQSVDWGVYPHRNTLASSVSPIHEFLKLGRLCVAGHSLPSQMKRAMLHAVGSTSQALLLYCPDTWAPLSRALILNDADDEPQFLLTAVRLCRRIGARPFVLTLGSSEKPAVARENWARGLIEQANLPVEYSILAGYGAATLIPRIADHLRCQVVVNRYPIRRWWRWGFDRSRDQMITGAEQVAFLSFPIPQDPFGEAAVPGIPPVPTVLRNRSAGFAVSHTPSQDSTVGIADSACRITDEKPILLEGRCVCG